MKRRITVWLILVTVAVWIIWDIYVATTGTGATESEVIRDWAATWSFLPYGTGVVAGHFFFNWEELPEKLVRRVMMVAVWVSIVLVLLADIFIGMVASPAIVFCGGVLVGHMLWPMEVKIKE